MPHKDKKEHLAYTKKYLQTNLEQKEKNKQRNRFNYWKNKILDYYFRHKIEQDIYKVREKTIEELQQICYDLGISEKKVKV